MAKTVKKTTKKEEVKVTPVVEAEVKEVVAKEAVAEVKEEVKKPAAKKTAAKKPAAKKAEVKKVEVKEAEDVKVTVTLQFAEKSYTQETLLNIAKDVWKFDLNQKEDDLKTVELYVKPEESLCYYVFNGDVTGSFVI